MKIAVIGGGWAGLAAACRLRRLGCSVVVYEAGQVLGGRARHVYSRALSASIDNGQHILLGAYTETLGLMRELGLSPDRLFHRQALKLESADGRFSFAARPLPAPFHLLAGLLAARGLARQDRLAVILLLARLQRRKWRMKASSTVADWLSEGRQSTMAIQLLWQPLCLAALNTPPEEACAQLFAHVLRDSLAGGKAASDVLIPSVDLSQLWPDQVEPYLAADPSGRSQVRRRTPVRHVSLAGSRVEIDGEPFDAAIVAANVNSALRLLRQLPASRPADQYLAPYERFDHLPIATVSFRLAHAWRLPQPMFMLQDDPAQRHFGQWLFDPSALEFSGMAEGVETPALLHVVASDARAMLEHTHDAIAAGVREQVARQTRRLPPMPPILAHDVIVEKRATFAARPSLSRPSNATPWPRVWVAGDWTDTGYPGVLEGAVRSGLEAAAALHRELGCEQDTTP